jgi:plasmid maintenance system antidote protein VapI
MQTNLKRCKIASIQQGGIMEIKELIERAKTRANLQSNYALAKALGIPQSSVTGWLKGNRHPSTDEAVQLATLAGLPEMEVIAEIELRTANNEKKKEFWKHYIESRGLIATVVFTGLAISLLLKPEPSQASVLHLQNYDEVVSAKIRQVTDANIDYAK